MRLRLGGKGVDIGVFAGVAVLVDVGLRVSIGDWDLAAVDGECKVSVVILFVVEHDQVRMNVPIKIMCFFKVHLLHKTILQQTNQLCRRLSLGFLYRLKFYNLNAIWNDF